jgi:predicted PurR-regulated permease PerM
MSEKEEKTEKKGEYNSRDLLRLGVNIMLFIVLFFGSLYVARKPLIPLFVAVLFAMSVIPLSEKVEGFSGKRWLGALAASLTVVVVLAAVIGVITYQVNQIANNWDDFKQKGTEKIEKAEEWVLNKTPVTTERLGKLKDKLKQSTKQDAKKFLSKFTGTTADFLLILVYIYLLIYYRHKFRDFFCKVAPANLENPDKVIEDTAGVAQGYLAGKFLVTLILSICYAVGLSLIGIQYALLIAVIGAVMNLVPYIGNIIAGVLGVLMALFTVGSMGAVLGVVGVFTFFQLLENYVLTPVMMERNIELNPFFTILAIIFGGALWGIPGMIIGIPYLAVMKVFFEHVDALNPLGELLEEKSGGDELKWIKKIKQKIKGD